MKNYLVLVAAMLMGVAAHAQFYVGASGGYAFGSNKNVIGKELSSNGDESVVMGSFGQGSDFQLRTGYFFNEKFGIDFTYDFLKGSEKAYFKTAGGNLMYDSKAHGVSLSLIYNVTSNIYGKFGFHTKVGGSTIIEGTIKSSAGSKYTKIESSGEMPYGFVSALGYKYPINGKISLFGELEYKGISITSKDRTITTISKSALGSTSTTVKQKIVKKKSGTKIDEVLLEKTAPYSSFGINVGILYSF